MLLNLEQPFSWESLKKAIGGFRRELTVQDMLRERAQERQFDGNGGNGISGGGSGDGSGGPEDEGFAGQFNEFLQVIMALIGVVFLVSISCHFGFCGEHLCFVIKTNYVSYNLLHIQSLIIFLFLLTPLSPSLPPKNKKAYITVLMSVFLYNVLFLYSSLQFLTSSTLFFVRFDYLLQLPNSLSKGL